MMIDYIEIIAKKILEGKRVALYTVGGDTFSVMRALRNRFQVSPVAVCDKDNAKQGRTYRGLYGVPVLSFEEADRLYPDAEYYISSLYYKYQIIGELTSSGKLDSARIINYEPVEWRTSCRFWEEQVFVADNGTLRFCCERGAPSVSFANGLPEAARAFIRLRDDFAAGTKGLNHTCDSCGYVRENWYPAARKFWWVNYFGPGICNYKCDYCTSSVHAGKRIGDGAPDLGDVIKAFQNENLLADQYSVVLSTSGEPTLHPKRKEFYSAFNGYALNVNTNGSIFDPDLYAIMQDKMVRLIVSLDAGTSATYKKIKGVDCFDRTIENLRQYQVPGMVVPKYIVMPGVNDDDENINGFINICRELDVAYTIIAYDSNGPAPIPKQSVRALLRLKNDIEGDGILCVPYTAFLTYEYAVMLHAVFSKERLGN